MDVMVTAGSSSTCVRINCLSKWLGVLGYHFEVCAPSDLLKVQFVHFVMSVIDRAA